jgi:tetratricopeptide (TPR) repeat protein
MSRINYHFRMHIRLLALFSLLLLLAATAQAQDYRALWSRGEYALALEEIERVIDAGDSDVRASVLYSDYADVLFAVGRVDEAIALSENIVSNYPLPSHIVRLLRFYHYRGRREEYRELLDLLGRQMDRLRTYRLDEEEQLALGQLMEMQGEDPQVLLAYYERLIGEYPSYEPLRVAAGDVALTRRSFDVAARHYGLALERDENNQEALAGLAEAYRESGDPRVGPTLERLRALNSHHPRLRLLGAERWLDLGEAGQALAELDSLLAINERHTRALALKGAGLFLQDEHRAMEAVQRQAVDFNPYASEVFRVAGRVASRHYRFEQGQAFQRRALALDAEDHAARLYLAFDLLRLGEDDAARAELETVFAANAYSVQAYNLLGVADALRQFKTVRRGLFELQMPEREEKVLAVPMLDLLDEAAALYQERYAIELAKPVRVQVFDVHDEFIVRSVGLPGSAGHLGICFGKLVTMDSPRARDWGSMNWQQVLWHEFVHVVTLQKTHNRMPRWLSEGISVYEETRRDTSWGQRLSPDFKEVVAAEELPGVRDLGRYFMQPRSAQHLLYGYYVAGEFARFYSERYGYAALEQSLAKIGAGMATEEALATAAGVQLSALDTAYRAHLKGELARLDYLADEEGDGAFALALATADSALAAGDSARAEAAYLAAHALYPDYAAADAPLRRIAKMYEGGPPDKYRAALQRVVAWDPQAHTECMELAALLIEQGRAEEAAAVLARAAQVIPFHVPLVAARARALDRASAWEDAAEQWRLLLYLDPARSAQHQLRLGRALYAQGEVVAARREVLSLLEKTPRYRAAQQLLLEMAAGSN